MDEWAAWFADRRHGGDAEQLQRTLEFLLPIRDDVIRHADIGDGDTVLDVGSGEGLIAFAAVERVGPGGSVIFSDVSEDLLDHCRRLAARRGLADRCRFLRASAGDLSGIGDNEVDAVTLRSVLIYEPDKAMAFDEFHRVLQPGGRLSVFEPINRFADPHGRGQLQGYEVTPETELADRVTAIYAAIQPSATDPMLNFDERDLLAAAERAGFDPIHLELRVSIAPPPPMAWEAFLRSSGNPRIPTMAQAMRRALTGPEADRLSHALRPSVERGIGRRKTALAFLWATRPAR